MEIIRFLIKKRIYYYIFLFLTLIIIFNIFSFVEIGSNFLLPSKDGGIRYWSMFYIFCLLLPFLLIIFYSKCICKFKIILLPIFSLLTIMIIVLFFMDVVIPYSDMNGLSFVILLSILVPTYLVFVFLYLGLEAYIKKYS